MRGIVLYIYEDICKEMMLLMIKAVLNNGIVRMITNIEQNKFTLNNIKLPAITRNKLHNNYELPALALKNAYAHLYL
jgi:uncharacterized protein YegL